MHITIIENDGVVGVDGVFRSVDLEGLDSAIRAIQFDTRKGRGHIEYDPDLEPRRENEELTDFEPYSIHLTRWQEAAPPPLTLDGAKAGALRRINAERERAIASGLIYGGKLYDADEQSRNSLTATVSAVNASIPLPAGFVWRTAHNQDIAMTAQDLVGLASAMLNHVYANYQRSFVLKDQINAATTIEQVNAITWSNL